MNSRRYLSRRIILDGNELSGLNILETDSDNKPHIFPFVREIPQTIYTDSPVIITTHPSGRISSLCVSGSEHHYADTPDGRQPISKQE